MSVRSILVVVAALVLLGCGDDAAASGDGSSGNGSPTSATSTIDGSAEHTADNGGAEHTADNGGAEHTADDGGDAKAGSTAADGSTVDGAGADDTGVDDTAVEQPMVIAGTVMAADGGSPLAGATVSGGGGRAVTDAAGRFSLSTTEPLRAVTVTKPGWLDQQVAVTASQGPGQATDTPALVAELQPFTVRALRVSRPTAANPERFEELLAMADASTVNALIFDTKDETGSVLYDTDVELASRVGAVEDVYDPEELLALARDRNLYTLTRIVVFEDRLWARGVPGAGLAGNWVDAGDESNWRYPLDLAVEACQLGFQEIQFDYVRFPAGRTAEAAAGLLPVNSEARSAVIAGFLEAAASELHPLGCGLSAAVFGIVTSSPTDEGIGQAWEAVTVPIDAVSPMVYPSHYSNGWLGLADPEQAPGPVVADALDKGLDRLGQPTLMRPWLQAFNYSAGQVLAQIDEAERRGAGWLLWHAAGNYRLEWLPPA